MSRYTLSPSERDEGKKCDDEESNERRKISKSTFLRFLLFLILLAQLLLNQVKIVCLLNGDGDD